MLSSQQQHGQPERRAVARQTSNSTTIKRVVSTTTIPKATSTTDFESVAKTVSSTHTTMTATTTSTTASNNNTTSPHSSWSSNSSTHSTNNNNNTSSISRNNPSIGNSANSIVEAIIQWGGTECQATTTITNSIGQLLGTNRTHNNNVYSKKPAKQQNDTIHHQQQEQHLSSSSSTLFPPTIPLPTGRGVLRSRSGDNFIVTTTTTPTKKGSPMNATHSGTTSPRDRTGSVGGMISSPTSPNSNNNNNNSTGPNHTSGKRVVTLLGITAIVCCMNIFFSFGGTNTNMALSAITTTRIHSSSNNIGMMILNNNSSTLEDGSYQHHQQQQQSPLAIEPVVRVLVGIFTTESLKDESYRTAFRNLFETQYPRICTLHEFLGTVFPNDVIVPKNTTNPNSKNKQKNNIKLNHQHQTNDHHYCELIYTFVIGSNPNGPTEIIDNRTYPILFDDTSALSSSSAAAGSNQTTKQDDKSSTTTLIASDLEHPDITRLNIKENMNDGKSQTWLYYASTVAERVHTRNNNNNNQYPPGTSSSSSSSSSSITIDYIVKMDTDSVLYLDRWYNFVRRSLIPFPYNYRTIGGTIVDKAWWKLDKQQVKRKEQFFRERFSSLHLYLAGQFYIVSPDVATDISTFLSYTNQITQQQQQGAAATATESMNEETIVQQYPYIRNARDWTEHHEDHDVTLFANLATGNNPDRPLKFIFIPVRDPFWRHNVKIKKHIQPPNETDVEWKSIWDEEIKRIKSIFHVDTTTTTTTSTKKTLFGKTPTNESLSIVTTTESLETPENPDLAATTMKTLIHSNDTDGEDQDNVENNETTTTTGTTSNTTSNLRTGTSTAGAAATDATATSPKSTLGIGKWLASMFGGGTTTTKASNVQTEEGKLKNKETSINEQPQQVEEEEEDNDPIEVDESLLEYLQRAHPNLFVLDNINNYKQQQQSKLKQRTTIIMQNLSTYVDIMNGIGDNRDCFIGGSSDNTGLERPIKHVHFNMESGYYYNEFATFIRTNERGLQMPDIISLNEIDYNITIRRRIDDKNVMNDTTSTTTTTTTTKKDSSTIKSSNNNKSNVTITQTHATGQLAKILMMNYAWAIESISVLTTTTTTSAAKTITMEERIIQFRGNAILSKCPLHHPQLVRDFSTTVEQSIQTMHNSNNNNNNNNNDNGIIDTVELEHYYFSDPKITNVYKPSGMGLLARTGPINIKQINNNNDNDNDNDNDNNDSSEDNRNNNDNEIDKKEEDDDTSNKNVTRTNDDHENESKGYVVAGTLYKLYDSKHCSDIAWQYMFQRAPPNTVVVTSNDQQNSTTTTTATDTTTSTNNNKKVLGIPPNQYHIGAIVSGDTTPGICSQIGLHDYNKYKRLSNYPANCTTQSFGKQSRVNMCSNIPLYKRFRNTTHLPCYYSNTNHKDSSSTTPTVIQLSSHGIFSMMFH